MAAAAAITMTTMMIFLWATTAMGKRAVGFSSHTVTVSVAVAVVMVLTAAAAAIRTRTTYSF